MEIKFSDIEDAFFYVSSAPMMTNTAVLCKETGEIFYASDYDDEDELREDIYYREDCIEIPHKNDLDLGRNLVFEFVEQHLPGDFDRVRNIFRRKGAYGRYKDLLDDRDLSQQWYDFENTRQTETLRRWCKDNEIKLTAVLVEAVKELKAQNEKQQTEIERLRTLIKDLKS